MKTNTAEIRKSVYAETNRAADQREIWGVALEAFRKFDGCMVSKAFATALQKKLPGATVYYDKSGHGVFTSITLSVWGVGSIGYNQRESFFLLSSEPFNYAEFSKLYTARKNENIKRCQGLVDRMGSVDKLVADVVAARAAYEAAVAALGPLEHHVTDGRL
jgi:hypothetical protein